jgi:uncharacterized protein YcfJ
MANPLFEQFGNKPYDPTSEFISEFNRIRQTVKNPRQEVQNLLNSGRMSQQDFNRLSQMTNQLMRKR